MSDTNRLANWLNRQREVIEAAETPFAKLAIFVLPAISPLVPATLTGLHLYKLLLQVFDGVRYADTVSRGLAIVAAIVLELLGYVGALSFIESLYRWIKTRQDEYLVPSGLNGLAYISYLIFMYFINVLLGQYFGTPPIMNNIVGLLSFITVPTSLLAANHLSQKQEKEDAKELRLEQREERLAKYGIKYGKFPNPQETFRADVESFQKVSNPVRKFPESFYELSSWRRIFPQLSREELESLASMTPAQMQECATETGKTYKTISNWRTSAREAINGNEEN